ncbi:uncharacterized protein [Diabrotica undecimpunctata]|uniref:uncharacterized protein n=1 Tax=Diabrotica undecimpunctata TaxID=50387 RepID=UPI003B6363AC
MAVKYVMVLLLALSCYDVTSASQDPAVYWGDYAYHMDYVGAIYNGNTVTGQKVFVSRTIVADEKSVAFMPGSFIFGYQYQPATLNGNHYINYAELYLLLTNDYNKLEWRSATAENFTELLNQDDFEPVQGGWIYELDSKANASLYIGAADVPKYGDFIGKIFHNYHEEDKNGVLHLDIQEEEIVIAKDEVYQVLGVKK